MMTDIHSHVLPGIDDGAPDLATSLEMMEIAARDGIVAMVATPHADHRYSFDARRSSDERRRLVESAGPSAVRLHLGCELHVTPENLEAAVSDPRSYTLNGHDCLLTELPDPAPKSATEAALRLLLDSGLRPVIAHPERNSFFHQNRGFARGVIDMGAAIQLTAGSITGSFGVQAQRCAFELLKAGLVHMVASDAHGSKHRLPLLSAARGEVARRYGRECAELLFVTNPAAVVAGLPITAAEVGGRRRFFFFLAS